MRNEFAANEAMTARVRELKRHADWALRNPPLYVRMPEEYRPVPWYRDTDWLIAAAALVALLVAGIAVAHG